MPKLFIFFYRSLQYAPYMELHPITTTNNMHYTFENCGKKYEIHHFVLIFHGNNPKVKVHKLNFEEVNV